MCWCDRSALLIFVSPLYQVSLEKCFGSGMPGGMTTETAFAITAAHLKAAVPSVKVLFYWHATVEIAGPTFKPCYAAGSEFLEHPDW